jgi:NADPH-dependent curcumin reductase CurA
VRGRLRNVRSYVPPLEIGDVIDGDSVGEVTASRADGIPVGALVHARTGWQTRPVIKAADAHVVPDNGHVSTYLGLLGMTGLTAYFGLLEVGALKTGETVLISGAGGAVGNVVGQIARLKGARAVGIAGSDEKVAWLRELGFDAAVNYKTAGNLRKTLKDACPRGVDVYFDNVGGDISDAAITLINRGARIVVCGQIATINRERPELGPRSTPLYLLVNRARMEGFLVFDYIDRAPQAIADLSAWLNAGKLRERETVVDGFEKTPQAFIGLFSGANVGKMVVRVA